MRSLPLLFFALGCQPITTTPISDEHDDLNSVAPRRVVTRLDEEIPDPRRSDTEELTDKQIKQMDGLVQQWETNNKSARLAATVIEVPVVIHIMKDNSNTKNQVEGKVHNQIKVLNDAFVKGDFHFYITDTLTHIDEDWWPEISRAVGAQYKKATRRGGYDTLNIWFNAISDGLLGYSVYPKENPSDDTIGVDGVVVLHSAIKGGTTIHYNLGHTLVHEVGHWLGLHHTFSRSNSCADADGVNDTPAEKEPGYGCPVGRDTCREDPGYDPIHNFMDYSYDSCMEEFTADQMNRMRASWYLYRAPSYPSCTDSPFKLRWKNTNINGFCTDRRITQKACNSNIELRSHCPQTCNVCTTFACEDSQATFMYRAGKSAMCSALDNLSFEKMFEMCNNENIFKTCRRSCAYCQARK